MTLNTAESCHRHKEKESKPTEALFGCSRPGRYRAKIRVVPPVLGPRVLNTGPRLGSVRLNRAGFQHRPILAETSTLDRFAEIHKGRRPWISSRPTRATRASDTSFLPLGSRVSGSTGGDGDGNSTGGDGGGGSTVDGWRRGDPRR
jgi:hypothetical protein